MQRKKKEKYTALTGYYRDNYRSFLFKFRYGKDDDIIQKLETVNNKSEYIKNLIRSDAAEAYEK